MVKYINQSGTVLRNYEYDAFGEEVNASASDANPFRYAGQYYDSETGTYYLRARYYSPALGRFTQQDAWGYGNPSDPLSLNLYVYCINNPVRYYDPTGNSFQDVIVGMGLALDDSLSDGLAQMLVHLITDSNHKYAYESEYDYYLGRVIGDILGMSVGAGESIKGILAIINAVVNGAGVTIGTGGAAAAVGVGIAVSGVAAGSVELAYGSTVIVMAASNLGDDWDKLQNASSNDRPVQKHHFASNKSSKFTKQFERIAAKYGLNLDDAWNKELMHHQGRHPNEYHQYVLDNMLEFERIAGNDTEMFLNLFEGMKKDIMNNPNMLRKFFWEN